MKYSQAKKIKDFLDGLGYKCFISDKETHYTVEALIAGKRVSYSSWEKAQTLIKKI